MTNLSQLDEYAYNAYMHTTAEDYPGPEFNEPIGAWDTSSVTRMAGTFRDFREFDQPIGAWDTSKVGSMEEMLRPQPTSTNRLEIGRLVW